MRPLHRLSEVEHWKLHLEQTVAAVDDEMAALTRAKAAAEDELEARHFDLETAQEALAKREGRLKQEVVRDDVEEALKQVSGRDGELYTGEMMASTGFMSAQKCLP